jgi:hypothetical protein
MKLDLLTNATVIDDAIRFVAEYQQQKREVVDACDAIDFAPVPSMYYTEKQQKKFVEGILKDAKEYPVRLEGDEKAKQLTVEEQRITNEWFSLFK